MKINNCIDNFLAIVLRFHMMNLYLPTIYFAAESVLLFSFKMLLAMLET